jgi:2-hydroxy-3-keto-5-methylthiopentenyl-1-phosphate phosphatase
VSIALERTTVLLDFDGTISRSDVGVHLLDRLADPRWREVEEKYIAGEIGSRECMRAQLECLPRDEARLREVAREIAIDPGLAPLVQGLRARGAEVSIVSDGFGFYIEDVLRPLGLPILTNGVDFDTWQMRFADPPADCPCGACGTCKRAPALAARARGRTVVLVGDGTSDRHAAHVADLVFAKAALAVYCTRSSLAFTPFEDLDEVRAALAIG